MKIIRTNNSDVAKNWANGVAASNHGKNYLTDGESLWSYNALIGITTKNGQKVLGDFTAAGGQFLSMTTSTKHVSPARRVACAVVAPETLMDYIEIGYILGL
jgi:hypothetical protein